ncbi:MAG: hypothetical protein CMH83_15620 [Nocardioides sp.]|nr:hypothetical protein [Nocardioides sp.]
MAKVKIPRRLPADPVDRGSLFTVRFALAIALMLAGIAYLVYLTMVVNEPAPGGPAWMQDLGDWNFLVGFGLFFVGLIVSAHPATPLGRGRGVVVGMLGCFLVGLAWICVYYALAQDIADNVSPFAIFNDLNQKNLVVGIGFMAVGFVFATRWE